MCSVVVSVCIYLYMIFIYLWIHLFIVTEQTKLINFNKWTTRLILYEKLV